MELTLQRVTKIEFEKITDHNTFSTRTITITMADGKRATVVCFAPNNEDEQPTNALKVVV
jgi:predicted acyl esterase